ncbi:hypothetical protein [Pyxidicoccus xibeiensis]|uniref:hypothetical protein n=1 Tax=Pyxidicoccus xibeiensis TaxID=2906759 RepID=UPI0020A6E5DE|nr:hypothetical protein [Pyxidicoccus xibeiensis]MCP3137640.1 hypothetical protein [Pyxidicoccus xibeiensis]
MADFAPFSRLSVSGSSTITIIDAVKGFSVLVDELMKTMNIQTRNAEGKPVVDAKAWYPLDAYMPVYKKIETLLGGRGLEKVGAMIPQFANFPSNIRDIHSALAGINVAYHMNHSIDGKVMFNPATGEMLEGIGHVIYQPVEGKNEAVVVCDDLYPCRFNVGLIRGMAQRFQPKATLTHGPHQDCRLKGAATCTYAINW